MPPFIWATANPVQRADWIRQHAAWDKMDRDKVMELFGLSAEGLNAIMGGAAWQAEYERSEPPATIPEAKT